MHHPSSSSAGPRTGPPGSGLRPLALVVLSAGLVVYNLALNLVPFPAWSYVPANMALAGLLLLLGHRAGLRWSDVGLARGQAPGVRIGVVAAVLIGAGLLAARQLPAAQPLLADERAAGLGGLALAYGALLRIPFGTAVPEEVVFRGVLLGLLAQRLRPAAAAIASSTVFGLWHVGPTIVLAQRNGLEDMVGGLVLVAVLTTFVAGLGFCMLRRWGGGLAAPVLTHTATNSLSLLAAAL